MLFAAGCDKTYVNEVVKQSPVIESFSPASGPVGTEIIITGQSLSGVTRAYIGDQEMVIKEKVSDSRLSIVAGANGRDGRIVLESSVGKGESEASFTYSYAVPSLKPALLQESVVMGDRLLLSGSNLTAVEAVLYTAEGCEESHEGEIYEQSASEIVARVPYVENGNVRITLRYFDGEASVTTPLDEAPFSLSRGQRQMVALASVVVMEPEVILLDEPTSGLDYRECMTVMETVREMADRGCAVVMVCHDMEVVSDFAERLVVMADGRILGQGETPEVFADVELMASARVEPPQIIALSTALARDVSREFAGVSQVSGIVDLVKELVSHD